MVLIILSVGAGLLAFLAYQHITQPGVPGDTVRITIPEGATGKDAARILAAQGLVEHEVFFLVAIRLDKSRKAVKQPVLLTGIRAGWYALPHGLSALELLHILQQGSNRTPEPSEVPDELKITIPEGLSIAQMARQFANPEAFIEAASDPALIARLGIKTKTLTVCQQFVTVRQTVTPTNCEGFLMPNTFYFEEKPTERQVVERMMAEFEKTYSGLTREYPPPAGYDMLNIVTVASLIEEEAKLSEERPKVAAVIYNRLEKGMPLQLDSTLQYALNKYGQRMLFNDRETDSPYNTYKNTGLPPGPISSPGADALKAALKPRDTRGYLYFVSNADGKSHTFSSNEADHLKAVRRFRKEIAPQRKAVEKQEETTKGRP